MIYIYICIYFTWIYFYVLQQILNVFYWMASIILAGRFIENKGAGINLHTVHFSGIGLERHIINKQYFRCHQGSRQTKRIKIYGRWILSSEEMNTSSMNMNVFSWRLKFQPWLVLCRAFSSEGGQKFASPWCFSLNKL